MKRGKKETRRKGSQSINFDNLLNGEKTKDRKRGIKVQVTIPEDIHSIVRVKLFQAGVTWQDFLLGIIEKFANKRG